MKKIISLFLVITFLGMNCVTYEKGQGINLEPGQKPGAKLIIQKTTGQQVKGELIAVKKDSLLLKDSQTGADVAVDITETETIKIVMKSKGKSGARIGFGIGATLGIAWVTAYVIDPEGERSGFFTYLGAYIGTIFILGTPLALLGWAIGGIAGTDETIQIEGKSEAEIKEILEDLRKKARVPNFQ